MPTLRQIYKSFHLRTKGKNNQWYKKSMGGKCPNRADTLKEIYWSEFGCSQHDQPHECIVKAENAKSCASERMADIQHLINMNKPVDISHIYPIIIAYGIGYKSYKLSGQKHLLSSYIDQFRKWYDELTNNRLNTYIHLLFTDIIGKVGDYPLELYDMERNDTIPSIKSKVYIKTRKNTTSMKQQNNWNTIIPNISNSKNNSNANLHTSESDSHNNSNNSNNNINNAQLQRILKVKPKRGGRHTIKNKKVASKNTVRL